ncbi:MAG: flotillin-like FloA family protein [Planctomycetes bacterium]|nr:flotillin-like FloA family protein [Planctomycetota bacterium]
MLVAQAGAQTGLWTVAIVAGFLLLVVLIVFFKLLPLWIQCVVTGSGISFFELMRMALRKIPPEPIVQARIMTVKGGVPVDTDRLQVHSLAGGDVRAVARALVAAHREGVELTFEQAAGLDLAGGDVPAVVQALIAARKGGIELEFERASSLQLEGHDVMEVVRTWVAEGA